MKRTLPWLVGGVVLTFSLLFGLYVAFGPFQPEEEVRRMLTVMSQVDTAKQTSGFSWTQEEDRERTTTTLYTEGEIALPDADRADHQTRFRVVRIQAANRTGDLSGEIRHVNRETFLTYNPPGPDVDGVEFNEENVWVAFEPGQLPAWGSLLPGLEPPLLTDVEQEHTWSPERIESVRELLSRADVFDVEFNDLTTFIDNERTRIFDARFDSRALRGFLHEYTKARQGRDELSNENLIRIENIANDLDRLSIRMWIGADTHFLRKIQFAGALPEEPGGETFMPVDVVVRFSEFNEPADITPPEETLSFSGVLQDAFGIFVDEEGVSSDVLPSDRPLVSDTTAALPVTVPEGQATDSDDDGLDNVTEAFFGTDPNNPDTDGDGVTDGEEVASGKNPNGPGPLFGFGLR